MIFGYARVSTEGQSLDSQIDALKAYGVDELFSEKVTGRKADRVQLNRMIDKLRDGDKVVVFKLDRISRSTKHLIELVELFEEKGVEFISLHDNIDTSTPMGMFFFRVMASLAELERELFVERTKAGLASARARGRLGGRPKKPSKRVELALRLYDSKDYTVKEITDMTGLGRTTLYRYIDQRKAKSKAK